MTNLPPGYLAEHPLPPGIVGALGLHGYQLLADVGGVGAGRLGEQAFLLVAPDPDPAVPDAGTQIALHHTRLRDETGAAAFRHPGGAVGLPADVRLPARARTPRPAFQDPARRPVQRGGRGRDRGPPPAGGRVLPGPRTLRPEAWRAGWRRCRRPDRRPTRPIPSCCAGCCSRSRCARTTSVAPRRRSSPIGRSCCCGPRARRSSTPRRRCGPRGTRARRTSTGRRLRAGPTVPTPSRRSTRLTNRLKRHPGAVDETGCRSIPRCGDACPLSPRCDATVGKEPCARSAADRRAAPAARARDRADGRRAGRRSPGGDADRRRPDARDRGRQRLDGEPRRRGHARDPRGQRGGRDGAPASNRAVAVAVRDRDRRAGPGRRRAHRPAGQPGDTGQGSATNR